MRLFSWRRTIGASEGFRFLGWQPGDAWVSQALLHLLASDLIDAAGRGREGSVRVN